MSKPLVSIITVVYNTQSTLERTINSVLQQQEDLFEFWIIDGGSTDGSVDIIRQYEHQLAGWVSEPDKGIYDAMNKGINRATGDWLYFLGADDILEPNILYQIMPYLSDPYVMAYGDIAFDNGRRVPSFLGLRTLLQNTIHHQGAFYKCSLFTNYRYNTKMHILSDYELNLKIYRQNLPTQRLPMAIACCKEGGASSHLPTSLRETNLVREHIIGNGIINKLLSMSLRIYYAQKQIRVFMSKRITYLYIL